MSSRFFFFKQKTAYEMRISDWSSDVCSSDLPDQGGRGPFLQPVPPYPGTDPLELPRHALEIIDRRSHPLPPSEALAGVLLDPLYQPGQLLRDPIGPGLPHRLDIGRAHLCTPATNTTLVHRILLAKQNNT